MKCVKQVLFTLALSGAVLTARAIPVHVNFSQGGWPGGGEITGSCIIDTDYSTVNPGTSPASPRIGPGMPTRSHTIGF
jgi:hypothetical protein